MGAGRVKLFFRPFSESVSKLENLGQDILRCIPSYSGVQCSSTFITVMYKCIRCFHTLKQWLYILYTTLEKNFGPNDSCVCFQVYLYAIFINK